ncbi:KxYKxGKxW signal peptide domain-containing protein [Weissella cibaria]|uniref:KxYKxGKxW signal peptide domain-containing protein n=1 Tax=Weissella cibaria TaxID=137591 RepID=UPI0011941CAD|nr:KxYKxGKxW signal peptide domain-containing protein [Weissella cibaria]TVV32333.1 LPXTG cell wall anchor domain-containing protein [Weissella cibaria]
MKNNKILSEADYIAKEHYKMYKAGKKWMVAGITAVSILGAVAMAEGTASADQVANTTSGTDPAVVKVDEAAATSQSATTVTLSASASVSSAASEVPAVTEVSASSEVVSSVVASEAVSSSSDVESSVAPASVSASVEASSSVSASVTPIASVSASVESSTVVESSSVVESVASSVAPVVNGHDSVAMSSMMSSAESAKAAGSIVAMRAVLADVPTSSLKTAGTIATLSDADNKIGGYAKVTENAKSTANDPHYLSVTEGNIQSYFSANGTAVKSAVLTASDAKKIASSLSSVADVKMSGVSSSQASMLKSEASYYSSLAATGGNRVYYTLTNGATQQGAVAFNKKVDMTKQWTINFDLNMTTISTPGDFIGLVLMDTDPNKLGTSTIKDDKGAVQTGSKTPGGALGVNGNANAFLWGIDTWKNNESGFGDLTQATANDWMIGFRHTNGNGSLVAATTADQRIINASSAVASLAGTQWSTGDAKGQFSYVAGTTTTGFIIRDTIASNAQSDVTPQIVMGFTAKFTPSGDGTGTLTVYDSQGRVVSSGTVGTVNVMTMALGFKAATGGNYSQMGVTITQPDTSSDDNSNAFNLTVGTRTVPVDYKTPSDSDISELADGTILANLGDVITINPEASETTSEEINAFDKTNDIKTGTPTIPGYKLLSVNDQSGDDISGKTITITDATKVSLTYAKQVQDTFNFVDAQGNTVPVDGQDTYVAGNETDGSSYDSLTYADAQKAGVTGVATIATLLTSLSSRGFSAFAIYDAKGNKVDFSSLKFGGSDAVYKVVLTPDTQSTTIHYIDANGKEISKVVNATAKVGSTLTPALVKSGYVYNSTTTKANAKNAGLAVDSAANYVVTKGVSDVYYTYNSYGVVLNVQKAGGKTVNMMGDGKAIPVASTQSSIADLLSLGSATSFTAAEKLLKQYGLVPAGYTLSGAQINGKAVDMAASFDLANFLVDGTSYVTDTADGTADSVATLLLLLTPSKQSATVTAVDSEGKSLGQEIGVITGDTDSSFTDAAASLKYPEIAGYTRVVTPLTDANGATSFDETNNALDADDASQQTIKVIYVLNPAQAGADKNVNVTADVTDAQAAFDKAVNATDATPSSIADAAKAFDKAVQEAVTSRQKAVDAAETVPGIPAGLTDNKTVSDAFAAIKTATDAAADGTGTTAAINNAVANYGDVLNKATAADQTTVAGMSVAKDADVSAADTALASVQTKVAGLLQDKTATPDQVAAAVVELTNAKNDYDAKVIAAVKKNDVTDAVSALATPGSAIETAVSGLNDALTSGDMTKIASAETALQNAVSDAAKQANVDADNAQKIVANMPSANDADVTAKSGALDQAQTELKNLLAADPAATTDAIATAVAKVKSAQKDYTDAVVAAVTKNDLTPDVNALAKSDTTVATAVSNLNDAMASGDMTKIADAETKLNTAVKNAATTANGDADSEQTQIADMTAAKDATVKAKNSALDTAQADLKTVLADKTATTDDIAKAVNAVNTAKSELDNAVKDAMSTAVNSDAVNAVAKNNTAVKDAQDAFNQLPDTASLADIKAKSDALKDALTTVGDATNTTVDTDQAAVAKTTVAKNADVANAGSKLDAAQKNLTTIMADTQSTPEDVAKAIQAVEDAKKSLDTAVKSAVKNDTDTAASLIDADSVKNAKSDLDGLLADGSTASIADIAAAEKKLTDAMKDVAKDAATKATDTTTSNVSDDASVKAAANVINNLPANATPQDIANALSDLNTAVSNAQTALQNAKDAEKAALDKTVTSPYDQETTVKNAKDAITKALSAEDTNTTATQLKNLQQALEQAVAQAKADRDVANAAATTAENVPDSVKSVEAVKNALAALDKAVADAANNEGTTAAITKAVNDLKSAEKTAQGAVADKITAGAQAIADIPANIKDDKGVQDKSAALNTLLTNGTATADDITKAINDLTSAEATAKQALADERTNATNAQTAATKDTTVDAIYTASKQAVADGTATDAQKALVKAYDKVTDLLADANDATTTKTDLTSAEASLQSAVDAYNDERAKVIETGNNLESASKADTFAVHNEQAVKDAQDELQTLLTQAKDNPTNPTTADLNNAITNLQNVINDAQAARDTAVKNANAVSIPANLADQAKDKTSALGQAVDNLATALKSGTTQQIIDATNALTGADGALAKATEAVKNAKGDYAGKAVTDLVPVNLSDNAALNTAAQNLLDAANSDYATADDLKNAKSAYENAKTAAETALSTSTADAKTAQTSIAKNLASDTDVMAANDKLQKLLDAPETSTKTAIDAAVKALQNAETAAEATLAAAKDSAAKNMPDTKPVSKETQVINAKTALENAIKDGSTASTADIKNLQDALTNAIASAEKARDAAMDTASDALGSVTPDVSDRPEISAAMTELNTAIAAANGDTGTTADVASASAKLASLVASAKQSLADVQDSAKNALAKVPVNVQDDTKVQQAEAALQKALGTDSTSTATDIANAQAALAEAVAKAQDALATSTSNASVAIKSIPVAVATEKAVTDAQSALDTLLKSPETSTKTQIDAAKSALDSAVAVAEKNRQQAIDLANAAAAATAPYGMEAAGAGTIADAAKALTDLTKTDATAEQIADATNALTKAVADASAVRAKSVNDAAQMVVPVNLSDQAADETSDVAAKKAALQDALDKAANNAGTSADIDAAKTALATAIADAKTKLQENKDKANATTAPTNMTDNDVVNDALTALKKVATDPNATQTALNKAQEAYTNAVTDEQDKLQTAKNAAKSVEAPKNMTDNTVVAGKLADLKKVAEDGDATATELANAQQAYDDAVKAEQGKLQDAKNAAADVTVPKNVSDNKTVTDLLTALHDTAADGNATASALTAAQKAYDDAVTEAQSALATKKSTADKTTIDTNISDDKATQDALANLKKIAEDKNATASDLQKAQDAYDKAVTDAQGVLNDGKETAQKSINSLDIPEAEGIRADPSVAEAEADLKAKLKDDNATATDIANAQNKLDQAVKVANKAIDDAKKALAATPVDTKTVKNESSVAAAQKALDDLMASQYTSLAQLNAAQETLQNAVDAAKAKRAVANNGANDAIANVPANVAGDATVKAAQANLQALVDAAAKDGQVADKNALTADILKATTALQSAVTAANSTLSESTDAAKSALNKVPTNVQDDADVQKQEAALNDVLSNPDSSKEEIDKAKSALDTAVTGAQSKLADAKDQAKQEVKTANDNKAWQDNVAVANATDALQNLIDSETATKTDIDNAIASLKSAEQAADNKLADVTATAKSALGKTAPVSGEKAVVDAAKDLQTLLDSGTATATQIADATKKLTDTVSAETTTRGKAVNDAASDVVPANVQDVKTVQDLQDKLQDALANAADDKGTTQAIKDAQKALDDAVKQAQSDLADVKNTAMSDMTNVPVNLLDDKSVTDAKAALNDAINSATATATDVKVAQQVLDDAVTAAKSAQEGAAATANTAVTGVPASVKDSDAVKDAIAKVQGLTKDLTADTATKSAIDQAKQELAAAVAAQQGVRSDVVTAAKSALDATAPVSGEVADQIAVLQKKLGDSSATASDIKQAMNDLNDAVATAKQERQTAVSKATETQVPAGLLDNKAIADLQAKMQQALKDASNDQGSTDAINKAQAALQTAIDDATTKLQNNKNAVDASVPTQLADDKSLNDAAAKLAEVAKDANSTQSDLDKAQNAYNTAKSNAETALKNAQDLAKQVVANVPDNMSDCQAVADAKKALQDKLADGSTATASEIKDAQTALTQAENKAQQALDTAKQDAAADLDAVKKSGKTLPKDVQNAADNLQKILDNPKSSKADVENAQKQLDVVNTPVTKPAVVTAGEGDDVADLDIPSVDGKTPVVFIHNADGTTEKVLPNAVKGEDGAIHYKLPSTKVKAGATLEVVQVPVAEVTSPVVTGDTATVKVTDKTGYTPIISYVDPKTGDVVSVKMDDKDTQGLTVTKNADGTYTVAGLPAGVDAVVSFDPNAVNAAAAVTLTDAAKQTTAGNAAARKLPTIASVVDNLKNVISTGYTGASVVVPDAIEAGLKVDGYQYEVVGPDNKVYGTLAEAVAANPTFTTDDNNFVVVYSPENDQKVVVKSNLSSSLIAQTNGASDTNWTGKTKLGSVTDASLKKAGYSYTVTGPDGKTYATWAEALKANKFFDNNDVAGGSATFDEQAVIAQALEVRDGIATMASALGEQAPGQDAEIQQFVVNYTKNADAVDQDTKAAQTDLNKVLANKDASAEEVAKAVSDYNKAVASAQADRDQAVKDANNVATSPVNGETAVKDAQSKLADVLKNAEAGKASTQDIKDAMTALQNAVKSAKSDRDAAVSTAKSVDKGTVANESSVKDAQSALDNIIAKAAKGEATTADVQAAAKSLQEAVTKATDARNQAVSTAKSVDKGTVANESSVKDAQSALDNIIAKAAKGEATTADVQAAAKSLQEAVTKATDARDKAIKAAQKSGQTAGAKNLSDNNAVQKAKDKLAQLIKDAAAGKATTADIEAATKSLNETVAKAQAALATAKKTAKSEATVPAYLSDSKSLQAAADKLAALAGDPNATATDLQNALTAYNKAKDAAQAAYDAQVKDAKTVVNTGKMTPAKQHLNELLANGATASEIAVAMIAVANEKDTAIATAAAAPVVSAGIITTMHPTLVVRDNTVPTVTAENKLPETGVDQQVWLTVAGTMALLGLFLVAAKRRKNDDKEA